MSNQCEPRGGNQLLRQVLKDVKVGAGVKVEKGLFYVFVAGFLVAPSAANATTGKRPVVAQADVDNTLGADGDLLVTVEWGTQQDAANDTVHPVAQIHVMSNICYLSSPKTVGYDPGDGPPAGTIISFNAAASSPSRPVRWECK